MSKVLFIAEKPSVARDLAKVFLGREFSGQGPHRGKLSGGIDATFISARGHLYELARPESYDQKYSQWNPADLPIVPPEKWKFVQTPREDAGSFIKTINAEVAAHAGEEIINACDAGREGEVIFRKVVRAAKPVQGTKFSRLWIRSMTDDALLKAFADRRPLSEFDGLGRAGQSRDEADWLIGMNATVLATKTLPRGQGTWKVWSIGRVQTPTLAMVVERDLLIENFVPQPFWEVAGTFAGVEARSELDAYIESDNRVTLLGNPPAGADRKKKAFWQKAKAEAFCASALAARTYAVTDKTATKTEKPPLPYDLQEMQKLFSKRFGISSTDTLAILQGLYEAKLITYPRTDSRYLPADMKADLHANLTRVLGHLKTSRPTLHVSQQPMMSRKIADASRAYNSEKVSDHFAIVPTGVLDKLPSLTGNELFAYLAILQGTLMALDEPARLKVTTRRWVQKDGGDPYAPAIFNAKREEPEYAGFTRWAKADKKEGAAPFAPLAGGTQQIEAATVKELKTNPPDRFTEAAMLDAMKNAGADIDPELPEDQREAMLAAMKDRGLGTPATRASIIDKLVERGFLERKKSNLISTPNGRLLIASIKERTPAFVSPQVTGEWELKLKLMESGKGETREAFLDGLLAQFMSMKDVFMAQSKRTNDPSSNEPVTEGTPVEGVKCPKTGEPVLDRGPFYEAKGFPKVRFWKRAFGREFKPQEWVQVMEAYIAGKTYEGKGLVSQAGKNYDAPISIDEKAGKAVLVFAEPEKVKGVKCPKSKKAIVDHGTWFEAPGWPGVRLYKEAFGRKFTAEEWLPILNGWVEGKPVLMDNLISKANKPYSAHITFDANTNRVKLEFPART